MRATQRTCMSCPVIPRIAALSLSLSTSLLRGLRHLRLRQIGPGTNQVLPMLGQMPKYGARLAQAQDNGVPDGVTSFGCVCSGCRQPVWGGRAVLEQWCCRLTSAAQLPSCMKLLRRLIMPSVARVWTTWFTMRVCCKCYLSFQVPDRHEAESCLLAPYECAVLWGLLIYHRNCYSYSCQKDHAQVGKLGRTKSSQLHPFVLCPVQGPASMPQLKRYPLRWQSRCSSSTCWAQLP